MSRLLDRRCVVVVDQVEVDGLRVAFKVHKDTADNPNTAEIQIFNLSERTRAGMQQKGAKVILSAGYADNVAIIFAGDARLISHARAGADMVTRIQCGDGERAYATTRVSEAFAAGARVKDVILRMVQRMGVDAGNAPRELAGLTEQFVNGYSAHGRARDELDGLLRSHGYEWSIQDGRLQVVKVGATTKDEAVELTPETGLVGSPEQGTGTEVGGAGVVKLRSLLQPRLRPAARVQVRAENVNGTLRLLTVDHRGDTHGGDWYSELEATPTK